VLIFLFLLILARLILGTSEEDIGVKFQSERGGKLMTAGESEKNPVGSVCGFFLVHSTSSATVCHRTEHGDRAPSLLALALLLVLSALLSAKLLLCC